MAKGWLTDIPAEIRQKVYKELFHFNFDLSDHPASRKGGGRLLKDLSLVSKEVKNETQHAFLEYATFVLPCEPAHLDSRGMKILNAGPRRVQVERCGGSEQMLDLLAKQCLPQQRKSDSLSFAQPAIVHCGSPGSCEDYSGVAPQRYNHGICSANLREPADLGYLLLYALDFTRSVSFDFNLPGMSSSHACTMIIYEDGNITVIGVRKQYIDAVVKHLMLFYPCDNEQALKLVHTWPKGEKARYVTVEDIV